MHSTMTMSAVHQQHIMLDSFGKCSLTKSQLKYLGLMADPEHCCIAAMQSASLAAATDVPLMPARDMKW